MSVYTQLFLNCGSSGLVLQITWDNIVWGCLTGGSIRPTDCLYLTPRSIYWLLGQLNSGYQSVFVIVGQQDLLDGMWCYTNQAMLRRLDPGKHDPVRFTSVVRNNQSLCLLKLTLV